MPDVEDMDLALKFKWKKKKHSLTTDDLTRLLTPLGATDVAPLTEKRKGHTVVIFNTVVDAVRRCQRNLMVAQLTLFFFFFLACGAH